jgi:GTPase-activating protein BEM2
MSPAISPGVVPKPTRRGSLDLRRLEQQSVSVLYTPRNAAMPGTSRIPWSALEKEGLSRDALLTISPQILLQSLTLYHRTVLECAHDNITAASFFSLLPSADHEAGEQQDKE